MLNFNGIYRILRAIQVERGYVMEKTGSNLVAEFISRYCFDKVFLVTGGACAFLVDALERHESVSYICVQHEQSAAIAVDAVFRTTSRVGVTMATSGPGATNLITGIACSWFDSIPAIHITGQVNDHESKVQLGVNVRQAGFQETDIAEMVRPITKRAIKVHSTQELADELIKCFQLATSGRMGPVLIDIPMNVQKEAVSESDWDRALNLTDNFDKIEDKVTYWENAIGQHFKGATRPLVVMGAGLALSGSVEQVQAWCDEQKIPYVSSWGCMPYIDRSSINYQGSHGVYGSRHANWVVQSADKILVLGSRLDNRQRTGNPRAYAPFAQILVFDIDAEELKKYKKYENYKTHELDLKSMNSLGKAGLNIEFDSQTWSELINDHNQNHTSGMETSVSSGDLNPYYSVRAIQEMFPADSIVASDCGANLCWVYQSYLDDDSFLFTAGGNSPMGYALPAAIGAAIANPTKKIYCFIGDGGLQMCIQELQTIDHLKLNITIVIMNNSGYGIIKQFQDTYFDGRHAATGNGYSVPDFSKLASAYNLDYFRVASLDDLTKESVQSSSANVIDLVIPQGALITPKTEMNRFIHDQFPYSVETVGARLPYDYPKHPNQL
jgi:acetolactate synthase-1/2/3 large subunit